jgi:hypothetical protein
MTAQWHGRIRRMNSTLSFLTNQEIAMIKKILFATMIAASMGGIATPAAAAVDVFVQVAPPPMRYEAVPAPRNGQVWAPGYWDWRNNSHVWHAGNWERDRPGHHYQPTQWQERDGRWHREPSRWDRDGDGVPNRSDRHPDNARRN